MNSDTQQGTDANFDDLVVNSDQPVLVDFWAPWCAPCRMVAPVLEDVAKEYSGRAKVVKVNVDEEQVVAGKMGIRSIPTIALFNKGKVEEVIVGASSKDRFTQVLDKALING